jgi:UV DNA damage endonuclease
MKIGYPCIHTEIGCKATSTFRLTSYSEEKLISTVKRNLNCLQKILEWNVKNNLLFFRITSDLVPFASHPVCTFDWQTYFKKEFVKIGNYIKKHNLRISMHPDQFVLINAKDRKIVKSSIKELEYHFQVLGLMKLDTTAKVQIHVGGVYGDKEASINRFVEIYQTLPETITRRLVIENDDYKYSVKDCINISKQIKIPIVFDSFHHDCLNSGESYRDALALCASTWENKDGIPIIDYSTQHPDRKKGAHTESIDIKHFKKFLEEVKEFDFDVMLEIKDKQKSALEAKNLFALLFAP